MQILINLLINLFFNFTEAFVLMGYFFVFTKMDVKKEINKNIIILIFLAMADYYIQHLAQTNYTSFLGILAYIITFTLFYAIKFRKIVISTILSFFTMLFFESTFVFPYVMLFGGKMQDLRNNIIIKITGSLITKSIAILVLIILYKRRCSINEDR